MSTGLRRWLFFAGATGFVAFFLWGLSGLPPTGENREAYGLLLNAVAEHERHVTDIVGAINFDYRAFDTLGEEFILFASVQGVVLLLRRHQDEQRLSGEDTRDIRPSPATSDAVQILALSLTGVTVTFGIYIAAHGQLTPGGGFQGGVVLATAALLVYLAGDPQKFLRIAPLRWVELAKSAGMAGFLGLALLGPVLGTELLRNVVPLGPKDRVTSGGIIPLISLTTGLEVSAAFVLLLTVFVEETLYRRLKRRAP